MSKRGKPSSKEDNHTVPEFMSDRKFIIPKFGPLAGIRVVGAGSLIAMPFAISMMADFGAEVIQVERPGIGDTYRKFAPVKKIGEKELSAAWAQEARNRLSLTLELNLRDKDAKDIFYKLIKESDVFIENLVWLDKLGIYDEELLNVNPGLVIVHISGFGRQEFGGSPETCGRASYDIIGQAFSGYAMFNGQDGEAPVLIKPGLNDYVTALFALFAIQSAYLSAKNTGKGQVVDVSQFEAMAKIMREGYTRNALNLGEVHRTGNRSEATLPWNCFQSRDGRYLVIGAIGEAVYARFMHVIGEDVEKYPYAKAAKGAAAVNSPLGLELEEHIEEWFASHDAADIEDLMCRARVPCSMIRLPGECLSEPHYLMRDDFVKYTDQATEMQITAFGIAPKFSSTPGRIWRGPPRLGQDTEKILKDLLHYSEEDIRRFKEKKII